MPLKVHAFGVVSDAEITAPLADTMALIASTPLSDRPRAIGMHNYQMEFIEEVRDGVWHFEFCKLNYGVGPGRAKIGEVTKGFRLANDEGFGESTSGLYSAESKAILLEYNHTGARFGTLEEYLSCFDADATNIYELALKIDPRAEENFRKKALVSRLKVAGRTDQLKHAHVEEGKALGVVLAPKADTGVRSFNVTLGIEPHSKNWMDNNWLTSVVAWIDKVREHDPDAISTIEVTGKEDPDEKAYPIKYFDQRLERVFSNIPLRPDRRYALGDRLEKLDLCLRSWRDILEG